MLALVVLAWLALSALGTLLFAIGVWSVGMDDTLADIPDPLDVCAHPHTRHHPRRGHRGRVYTCPRSQP